MPIADFRSFIGIAKDTIETYLTAAVTAGATSIPVAGTAVPASSTIFFVDGANSESRAVTAGGGSSTLTVTATTNAHAANTIVFAQLTASLGPVGYLPVTAIDFGDDYNMIDDKGVRGSNVEVYGTTQADAESTLSLGGDLIPDQFGYILGSIFGAVDFTGGTPNQHIFAGMNTAASNGQPTPLLVYDYNGYNTRCYAGAKLSEVQIKYDPKANVTWTAKGIGYPSIVVANPTVSFSALQPQAAWQAQITVGGVYLPRLLTADITIKRTVNSVQTCDGTQTAYKVWAGPLSVTGNFNFVMEDDSDVLNYVNNTQPTVTLAFINGTGAAQTGLSIQMTKCVYTKTWKAKQVGSNGYVEVGGPITALANTTDANTAGGGYSPAKVTLRNSVATGTYQ